MNYVLAVCGCLISIGSAVTIVWKLLLPHVKEVIRAEISDINERFCEAEKLVNKHEEHFNYQIGSDFNEDTLDEKFKVIGDKLDDHMRQTQALLEKDFESITLLKTRQTVIRQGLVALMKSVLDSQIMNNKVAIENAKEDLINDLLANS
jgi:hypothetical protein